MRTTAVIADGGGEARMSGRDRLAEALQVLETDPGGTHPDGCVALLGYYDDAPDRLWWLVRSTCRFAHPETMRGLRVQYSRRGWAMTFPDPVPATPGADSPAAESADETPLSAPLWMWAGYLCGIAALAVVATTGGAGSAAIVVLTALLSVFFWVFGTERGWTWTRSATGPLRLRLHRERAPREDRLLAR